MRVSPVEILGIHLILTTHEGLVVMSQGRGMFMQVRRVGMGHESPYFFCCVSFFQQSLG